MKNKTENVVEWELSFTQGETEQFIVAMDEAAHLFFELLKGKQETDVGRPDLDMYTAINLARVLELKEHLEQLLWHDKKSKQQQPQREEQ